MSEFKVGEIAVLVNPEGKNVRGEAGSGAECELREYQCCLADGRGWWVYFEGDPSSSPDGLWWVAERDLRKKNPPLGRWEDIEASTGWSPDRVNG
jgi:hypothetical protein